MVGLPARGKTYIATKLAYYLNWVMLPCKGAAGAIHGASSLRCAALRCAALLGLS
jgi:signal recognition particle GTPase